MNGSHPEDPLEALRRANPADADDLPSASLARVRASVLGDLHRDNERAAGRHSRPSRRPLVVALGGLAAAILVAVGVLGLGGELGRGPGETGGPLIGACVETYSLETLRRRSFAFDGTVVAVTGDRVTFRVETPFRGVDGSEITLTAMGLTGGSISPGGGVTLAPGGRYLVAGDATFAWGCGFTQPYDPTVAGEWAAALRS